MERHVDVAVIGAGTAGISAISQVRRHTENFVLINGGPQGTTCARVGCMPSKILLQTANDHAAHGVDNKKAMTDLRSLRDGFVKEVIDGFIHPLGDRFIEGYAEFVEPTVLRVDGMKIRAENTVIATGSRPLVPDKWKSFEQRILTTDNVFEQSELPRHAAVIGLGPIGLELGQALSRMGVVVTGFDTMRQIAGIEDPDVNEACVDLLKKEFSLHLGEETSIEFDGKRLAVIRKDGRVVVDKVLVSVGRVPNVESLRLDRLGKELDEQGLPPFDPETLQVAGLPIFVAGDVNGYRPVLHEAVHEGRMAGYNATHKPIVRFERKTPLSIAFCEPNVCSVGKSWNAVKDGDLAVGKAAFEGGRARILDREHGIIKLYGDPQTGRLVGSEMVAPQGEHLGHLLAWSVQNRLTVFDLLELPFYHPTIEETLQEALKNLAGNVNGERPPVLGLREKQQE
jgi:dihydrolipoamide dehydrogenase